MMTSETGIAGNSRDNSRAGADIVAAPTDPATPVTGVTTVDNDPTKICSSGGNAAITAFLAGVTTLDGLVAVVDELDEDATSLVGDVIVEFASDPEASTALVSGKNGPITGGVSAGIDAMASDRA